MIEQSNRLDRALAALEALSQPVPAAERFSTGMEALAGVTLSGASEAASAALEACRVDLNAAIRNSPAAPSTTIPEFSDTEASSLAEQLKTVCELVRNEETDRILTQLHRHRGVLPEAAIEQIRRQPDWFVPRLLHECQQTVEEFETKNQNQSHDITKENDAYESLLFFSLFLFSELNVSESLPVMLRALKLPSGDVEELFDEAVNDQVPRFLAQFCADDFDLIDGLIRDPTMHLYARWAAVDTYRYLVRDQRLSIGDAVKRLDRLFQETKVVDEGGDLSSGHQFELSAGIVDVILVIGGASLSTIGENDSDWDFVDEYLVSREGFTKLAKVDVPSGITTELRKLPPTRVEDCLEELRGWAEFEAPPESTPEPPSPAPSKPSRPAPKAPNLSSPIHALQESAIVSRPDRVGRNAPCPCGSGKKYKQCCLLKQN